ncbi:hypothetical protein GWK08_00410 [Leptobacterium flavescens]|uniref:STAS/SEC14 domain-containing protein n=1 Tax=Leptobacterium flavescens TaxID=472055 RepID=A0A6P0UIZ1_9FLAO|nr:STAS/SEC14 domain-containing protein [Leptobacterium flavescens]NER11888.1 hypothetical protein [Leptobacterium flavescens]
MSKKVDLEFGSVEFYDSFAVGVINEGVDLKSCENKYLLNTFENEYKNKPFGFISNRIHSYSVDPTVYKETSELKNLVAIAVVMSNPVQRLSVEIEKLFFDKPFEYFMDLEEAKNWIKTRVQ